MKSDLLTDVEIRARGWDALLERLGPSGALRYTMQTQQGHGDYAALRHKFFGALSVDDLVARMRKGRPANRAPKRR